jgi:glycosyltransferase involved in cell wall biosynthesis
MKKNKKISGHMVVKNEEKWIWYSIQSIIDYVDELIIFDTGSTDKTVEIIKSIDNDKIIFRQMDFQDVDGPIHTMARQEMLRMSKWNWIFIVDGDEVWTQEAAEEMVEFINNDGDNLEFLIRPYQNLIGDVFHYQEESAGKYQIGQYRGHITIRAINAKKIPGLNVQNPYPLEGFYDKDGVVIQDRKPMKAAKAKYPYLHMTHLERSSSLNLDRQVFRRQKKYKYELGIPFPESYVYPKCFYMARPELVPSPWNHRDWKYTVRASIETPLKKIKRLVESYGS